MRCIPLLIGSCTLMLSVGSLAAQAIPLTGTYTWSKIDSTLTGTLTPAAGEGQMAVVLVPKWKGKETKPYTGTLTIAADGSVSGEITHDKEGTYKITGKREGDTLTCEYDGRKSSKKNKNPVVFTIVKPKASGT